MLIYSIYLNLLYPIFHYLHDPIINNNHKM
nr:MAG TPA: hypothetical protein [Caudoviricetes sp.]